MSGPTPIVLVHTHYRFTPDPIKVARPVKPVGFVAWYVAQPKAREAKP